MIDKNMASADAAAADIPDGVTPMVGGFGPAGQPHADLWRLPASHISNIAGPGLFNRCVVGFLTEKE